MQFRLIDRGSCASSPALGTLCVAAILFLLHWTAPLVTAPSVVAEPLYALAGDIASAPCREPCEPVRTGLQSGNTEVSSHKKKADLFRSGTKPMALLDMRGAAVFPVFQPIVSLASSTVPIVTSFSAFRAQAPPVAIA